MGSESTATSGQRARAGSRWDTVPPDRRLLAVAHNVTAATRLLDLLRVVDGDRRIATSFTWLPGSRGPGRSGAWRVWARTGRNHVRALRATTDPDGTPAFPSMTAAAAHLAWLDAVDTSEHPQIEVSVGPALTARLTIDVTSTSFDLPWH
ncbi:hypothetical protein ACU686_11055 [Yinghuangia aomiensis]